MLGQGYRGGAPRSGTIGAAAANILLTGGVERDEITPIRSPHFLPVAQVTELGADEPVIYLEGECGAFAFYLDGRLVK